MIEMGIISTILGKKKNETPPICDVDLERYLGTWYEIARYPNRFEEGLDNATANYTLRSDGRINVIKSGLKNGQPEDAKAKKKMLAPVSRMKSVKFGRIVPTPIAPTELK